MTTVVDQVRPWLTPSSTFAATIHAHDGAQISSSGTGSADQPAGDQDRFAAEPVRQGAGEVVGRRLGHPEREDVGQRRRCSRAMPNTSLASSGSDGALLAEHPADQGVDRDQQRELGDVRAAAPAAIGRCSVERSRAHLERATGGRRPSPTGPRSGPTTSCAPGPFEQARAQRRRVRRARTSPPGGPGRQRVRVGERAEFDVDRSGQVAGREFAGLPDVDHRGRVQVLVGPHDRCGRDRLRRRRPTRGMPPASSPTMRS